MKHQLPNLPFDINKMTELSSAETFEFHHQKHHAGYINKLNDAIAGTDYENMSLEEMIIASQKVNDLPVYNNAAQHWNHTFFWNSITSPDQSNFEGKIKELIERDFENLQNFEDQFSLAASTVFGSGWAWLVINNETDKLEIIKTSNADTPLTLNKKALLTIDVWEHAYYIDYRNVRPDFIKKFWKYVNWNHANNLIA